MEDYHLFLETESIENTFTFLKKRGRRLIHYKSKPITLFYKWCYKSILVQAEWFK